jgi:hypothetical protein
MRRYRRNIALALHAMWDEEMNADSQFEQNIRPPNVTPADEFALDQAEVRRAHHRLWVAWRCAEQANHPLSSPIGGL